MLIRYIVKNFGSVIHPAELDLRSVQEHTNNIFLKGITTKIGLWDIQRYGIVFDPYASSSPIIKSIEFARNYILNIPIKKNEINHWINDTASFQFIFYDHNKVYEYGFSTDQNQIHEEWLMFLYSSHTEMSPLFTRITDNSGKTEIDIESQLLMGNTIHNTIDVIGRHIKKDELFLSHVHNNGIEHIENVFDWFQHLKIHGNCLHIDNDANVLCDTDCNNSDDGQAIFITDDLTLMDFDYFQQDEIWLANRVKGEFRLRPLSDFEIHNPDILKAYLCGRFG